MTALIDELQSFSTLIGQVGAIGFSCLMALHIADPASIDEPDLMTVVHVDSLSTLRKHLSNLSAFDFASFIKPARNLAARWHITDIGKRFLLRAMTLLGLPGASTGTSIGQLAITAATADSAVIAAPDVSEEKNFFSSPSSSSDQIDQSVLDSDQIESEEEEAEFKKYLCRFYGFTGERAAAVIASEKIFSEDICAWMYHVAQMEGSGFRFRKSSAAYALACLLKNDAPPARAIEGSRYTLDQQWTLFCQAREAHEA